MKKLNLERLIQAYIEKSSEDLASIVHIGYFEDEGTEPSYDDARVCPFCNESLIDTSRHIKTIIIHCTKYPLATFLRFHTEELQGLMESKYHQIIVNALEQRSIIEKRRKIVPSVFRSAFEV